MTNEDRKKVSQLFPDRPAEDPASDRLGYAPFAKHLAESITRLATDEGLVIAVFGAWGAGKTTMLNYVRHYIGECPEDRRPAVVTFNPWWFSGSEGLMRAFFGQLQAHLGGAGRAGRDARNMLADLSEIVGEAPLPYAPLAKPVAKLLRTHPKDVTKLKEEISAALLKRGKRILVIIDDIDRLAPEEVRAVFRVVKSVADFPNVTYLMAFDKSVVAGSLEYLHPGSGQDYLEKIVQAGFELPAPDRLSIRSLFFERLDAIISGTDPKTFDQAYWGNVFLEGIDSFLDTPRDAVRLANALVVTFKAVLGEVNVVDFIAIESLRVFCPEVYQSVRGNAEMFAGGAPTEYVHPTKEELAKFHEAWIKTLRESSPRYEAPVRTMLKRLFPKLESVWGNTNYGGEWLATWRRERRICAPEVFPIYFALAVTGGDISNAEMQTVLANVCDPEWLSEEFLRLSRQLRPDGKTRVSALLENLVDYAREGIPVEGVKPIMTVFYRVGDQLAPPQDQGRGFFEVGNEVRMGRVAWQLLRRVERDKRFEILREGVETGNALSFAHRQVIVLAQQQGEYGEANPSPESEWLITHEQLAVLKALHLERIREASSDGTLWGTPTLRSILGFWQENASQEEAARWVSEGVEDDGVLAKFLEAYLQTVRGAGLEDAVVRESDRLDPEWLRPYIDPDQLFERIKQLPQRITLTPRQKRAVDQFLKEHELRRQGGDPNSPFAQFSQA
jgi:predicted KAP-like P-loop ATPase